MSLEKLTIQYEQKRANSFTGKVQALFNPDQLSFSRRVNWVDKRPAENASTGQGRIYEFSDIEPATLSVSLFFDTYDDDGKSVLKHTQKVAALAALDAELHRPPVCKLQWGKISLFTGVLESLDQKLLLFLKNGTPVRATLDCTFKEYAGGKPTTRGELHSADVDKRYTLRPGDTLMHIAFELYGDTSRWRIIAEANGIDNPRKLTPGQVLVIPAIDV